MVLDAKAGGAPAFTGAAMVFLLLFIVLPKLIREAMKTDAETILTLFGKNEQFRFSGPCSLHVQGLSSRRLQTRKQYT
jgi:hypothetical protein